MKYQFLLSLFKNSLEQLTTRVNLLDGTNIDHIDMKLENVLGLLNAINDKQALVDEHEKQSKVNQKFIDDGVNSNLYLNEDAKY